ncbi:MAG: endonuclease/exonuclease/phosphatase family metal-dependent hydrolase [Myxococcota bacterium]|jgi:endonuclease/exonuclease/phosphatase family metal-dependent hydrolase
MRCVTYNLNGLDDTDVDVRTEHAILSLLVGEPLQDVLMGLRAPDPAPDVICLQEVTARTYFAHIRPHLVGAGYTLFPAEPRAREHFEVIASRLPVAHTHVETLIGSLFGRERVAVQLANGLWVITAHMDSLKDGKHARQRQLRELFQDLVASPPSVFLGDTNLRDSEVPDILPDGIVDAWEAAGSPAWAKNTWAGKMRFDRAYVSGMTVTSVKVTGRKPMDATGTRASDHAALWVTLN